MTAIKLASAFAPSRFTRLSWPEDVRILLDHADELAGRLGITLRADQEWRDWLELRHRRPAQLADADAYARYEATAQVCDSVAFVLCTEDDACIGYWLADSPGPLAGRPLVKLDRTGRFIVCAGRNLAEALLSEFSASNPQRFEELREWFDEMGVRGLPPLEVEIPWPTVIPSPGQVQSALQARLRRPGR